MWQSDPEDKCLVLCPKCSAQLLSHFLRFYRCMKCYLDDLVDLDTKDQKKTKWVKNSMKKFFQQTLATQQYVFFQKLI